jgi:hypothetical protein
MQYEISDQAAVAFARGFYGAITHGRGVDEAVSAGRVAIVGLSGRTLEWLTPVLYLRGNDSRLFTMPSIVTPASISGIADEEARDLLAADRTGPQAIARIGTEQYVALEALGNRLETPGGLPAAASPDRPGASDRNLGARQGYVFGAGKRPSWTIMRLVAAASAAILAITVVTLVLFNGPSHGHTGGPTHSGSTGPSPSNSHSGSTAPRPSSSDNLTNVISEATSVPESTLAAVGPGTMYSQALSEESDAPLTAHGKPELLYISAAWCPYCAADQWALVVALSRFGTFTGLQPAHSAPSPEEFPNTATLSFYGSGYSSRYLVFTSVENENVTYETVQQVTSQESAAWKQYLHGGGYPFVDIGNAYMGSSLFGPAVLKGDSEQEIAAALSHPSSPIAQAVDGAANELIAAICSITHGDPISVCSSPTVQKLEGYLWQNQGCPDLSGCYRPRYLNIQRLNYLWTIRHSSARIAGNLIT